MNNLPQILHFERYPYIYILQVKNQFSEFQITNLRRFTVLSTHSMPYIALESAQTPTITRKQQSSSIISCLHVANDAVLPIRIWAQRRGIGVNFVFQKSLTRSRKVASFCQARTSNFRFTAFEIHRITDNHPPDDDFIASIVLPWHSNE